MNYTNIKAVFGLELIKLGFRPSYQIKYMKFKHSESGLLVLFYLDVVSFNLESYDYLDADIVLNKIKEELSN